MIDKAEISRLSQLLLDAPTDLLHVLDSVQKDKGPGDWYAYVMDVMLAIEAHDSGLFDSVELH